MILYTILSDAEIFEEPDDRNFVHAAFHGIYLVVEPLEGGKGRIERVLSTDPGHYLRKDLQPGAIVHLLEGM